MWVSTHVKKEHDPGAGVPCTCEQLDSGARDGAKVLWKSKQSSEPTASPLPPVLLYSDTGLTM